MKKISFAFAKGCAWRATYVRYDTRQIAYIGIDPDAALHRLRVFGGVRHFKFRFNISCVSWRFASKHNRFMWLYKWQGKILLRLDGRNLRQYLQ